MTTAPSRRASPIPQRRQRGRAVLTHVPKNYPMLGANFAVASSVASDPALASFPTRAFARPSDALEKSRPGLTALSSAAPATKVIERKVEGGGPGLLDPIAHAAHAQFRLSGSINRIIAHLERPLPSAKWFPASPQIRLTPPPLTPSQLEPPTAAAYAQVGLSKACERVIAYLERSRLSALPLGPPAV